MRAMRRRQYVAMAMRSTKSSSTAPSGLGSAWQRSARSRRSDLASDSTNERRIIGRVHRGEIGNLHRNDVAENSKSDVNRQLRTQLIGKGNSRLIDKRRRGGKQVVGISHYHFDQRFI